MTAFWIFYDYICCENRYPSTLIHNNQNKTSEILFRIINFSFYERKKNLFKFIRPWTLKRGLWLYFWTTAHLLTPTTWQNDRVFYVFWLYLMYKHPDVSLRTKAFHYHDHPTLEWEAGLCLHLFLITPSHTVEYG